MSLDTELGHPPKRAMVINTKRNREMVCINNEAEQRREDREQVENQQTIGSQAMILQPEELAESGNNQQHGLETQEQRRHMPISPQTPRVNMYSVVNTDIFCRHTSIKPVVDSGTTVGNLCTNLLCVGPLLRTIDCT